MLVEKARPGSYSFPCFLWLLISKTTATLPLDTRLSAFSCKVEFTPNFSSLVDGGKNFSDVLSLFLTSLVPESDSEILHLVQEVIQMQKFNKLGTIVNHPHHLYNTDKARIGYMINQFNNYAENLMSLK